ncbi:hypothetical protein [Lysobacter silvisoli]|uniref:hypothetical protein n=1 Tax=Lysobacter silvisoli TaxID=2293254 RepID=UPI0011C04B9A|nr:hypothetical protein [Lysobacter silvisoli]
MSRSEFKEAMNCLDRGDVRSALAIADNLTQSPDERDQISGYLCRGFAYEDGGDGLTPDLAKAIHNYRKASLLAPDSITFCHLARASIKLGEAGLPEAWKFLVQAKTLRDTPEVILGFAKYYREKNEYEKAKYFYRSAALRGRFAGFFGYSEISRILGQNKRAMLVDSLRVLLGPLIALLIGNKAQEEF